MIETVLKILGDGALRKVLAKTHFPAFELTDEIDSDNLDILETTLVKGKILCSSACGDRDSVGRGLWPGIVSVAGARNE